MKPSKILKIESPENAHFKSLKSSLETSGIKKTGLFLLSGKKIVPEILSGEWLTSDRIEGLLFPPQDDKTHLETKYPYLSFEKLAEQKIKLTEFSTALFKELDIFGTNAPILVGKVPPLPKFTGENARGLEVVLPLSDPGNLGASLRVCEAMGVRQVLLTQESANPFHPKVSRAASGSNLRVKMVAAGKLSDLVYTTVTIDPKELAAGTTAPLVIDGALDLNGENLMTFKWPKNFRLLVGEEGQGLPENLKCQRLTIPMNPTIESLNAAMALSMALFSYKMNH